MENIVIGSAFGRALCEHLGLPASKVSADLTLNTGPDEIFSVTLNITLNAKDITEIGMRMRDNPRHGNGPETVIRKVAVHAQ